MMAAARKAGPVAQDVRVRLITNPLTDTRLERAAERFLGEGVDEPEDLEEQLRADFPRVRVVPGLVDVNEWRWYVYRDGSWVNSEKDHASSAAN